MNTQYIRLNMVPAGVLPVMHTSQFDIGRPLGVVVYDGSAEMDLDDYTVTIEATRTDGTPITAAVTTDGNIGAFVTTATMTNKDDLYPAQLVIVDGDSNRVASLPFMMRVVEAAMDENSEAIEEDAPLYQQYNAAIQALIVNVRAELNAEVTARQNAIAAETAARIAADATLQSNINTEASTRAATDTSLQAQINQLIAPTGTAPSAAEVENARIGADGVTYQTLGEAIRTNDTELKNAINSMSDGKIGYQIVNNSYITTSGVITPYNGWSRTEYLHCDEYAKLIVIAGNISDSQYNAFYDGNKTFISKFTVLKNTENEFTIPSNAVYFICSNNTAAMSKYAFRFEDSRVKNALKAFEAEESTYRQSVSEYKNVSMPVSTIPSVEKKTGVSASASSIAISFSALATMDTYVLFLDNNISLYFDNDTISQANYLAICKIENAVSGETAISGTNGERYRNLDSNLPTSSSPLLLSAGSAIAITIDTGTDVSVVTNGIMRTLSDYMLLGQTQLNQIETQDKYITFNGSMFSFDMGNHKLYIVHEENSSIRQNTWRLKRASIVSNGVEYDMWNGSDADGVVHLDGETDFIGGFHGDEDTTAVSVFLDGEEISMLTAFSRRQFKTFAMFVASNVYHCNESDDAANVAFVRNKLIFIDGEKCSISNHWVASEEVHVNTAYFGMLSVAKALVTNYALNSNYAILDNETSGLGTDYCDRVDMFLDSGNVIEYYMSDRSKQEPWGYSVIYDGVGVSDRVKAYFAEIYKTSPEYVTLNQGDVIRATSTMVIH